MAKIICYRCYSEIEELTITASEVKADMTKEGYDVSEIPDDEIISFTFCPACGMTRIPLLMKLNKTIKKEDVK